MALEDYYQALERLKTGVPLVVPKGTKITNDSVSEEAGRKKGSIKKSRPQFAELIAAIDMAATAQKQTPERKLTSQLAKAKDDANTYRALYEAALSREQSLVVEIFGLKQRLAEITGQNVIPIIQTRSRDKIAT